MKKDVIKYRLEIINSAKRIGISKSAKLHGVDRSTIRRWIKKFEIGGESGLQNISKKDLACHKMQMPKEIEKEIIKLKTTNPKITIDEITTKLSQPFSRSTVFKKLKQFGLAANKKQDLSGEILDSNDIPFTQFYLNVSKLSTAEDGYQYIYTITEQFTNVQFSSFSSEHNQINFLVMIDLFLTKITELGINSRNITINMKRVSLDIADVISKLNKKFHFNLKHIERIPEKYSRSLVKLTHLNEIETKKFIVEYYSNLMLENSLLFNKFSATLIKKIESIVDYKKIINKLIYRFHPIDLDHHFNVEKIFTSRQYWSRYEDRELYEKGARDLIRLGSQFGKRFENDKALNLYNTIITVTKFTGNIEFQIYSILYKGTILQRVGRWEETEQNYLKGLTLSKRYRYPKLEVKFLAQLGVQYLLQSRLKQSIKFLERSLKKSRVGRYRKDEINALLNLGAIYLKMGDYSRALKRNNTLFNILEDSDPRKVTLYANTAVIFQNRKQFDRSMELFNQGLAIGRELNSVRQITQILNNLGNLYLDIYRDDDAIRSYRELLTLAEKQGNRGWIGIAHHNIGRYFQEIGDYSSSLIHFKKSYEIAVEIDDINSKGINLLNSAELYLQIDSLKASMDDIDSAIEIFESNDDKSNLPQSYLTKGKIYLKEGRYHLADKFFTLSINLIDSQDSKDHYLLSSIYREVTRLLRASSGYSRYTTTKEEFIIKAYELYEDMKEFRKDSDRYGEVGEVLYFVLSNPQISSIDLDYSIPITIMISTLKKDLLTLYSDLFKRSKRERYKKCVEKIK